MSEERYYVRKQTDINDKNKTLLMVVYRKPNNETEEAEFISISDDSLLEKTEETVSIMARLANLAYERGRRDLFDEQAVLQNLPSTQIM